MLLLTIPTALGWLLREPALFVRLGGTFPMALNGSILFALCASWLIVGPRLSAKMAGGFRAAMFLALGFTGAIFLQHILSADLGVDFSRQGLSGLSMEHPGRLAANTCIGLLLAEACILLLSRTSAIGPKRGWGIYLGAYGAGLIGLLGILGHVFQLEALYEWYRQNDMALATAASLFCLGLGLAVRLHQRLRAQNGPPNADQRITYISALLLISVAAVSVLVGFGTIKGGAETIIRRDLLQLADTRRAMLVGEMLQARDMAHSALAGQNITRLVLALKGGSDRNEARENLAQAARRLKSAAIDSVEFENASGERIDPSEARDVPGLRIPLRGSMSDSALLWDGGLVLEANVPIGESDQNLGRARVRVRLVPATDLLFSKGRAPSEELKLCASLEGVLKCFPSRQIPHVHEAPASQPGERALPYPIALALEGKRGTDRFIDLQGRPVLGAFEPLDDSGLGLVQRIDAIDVYSPVEGRLLAVIVLPFLLAFAGVYVLRKRVRPLIARIIASEQRARDSEREARTARKALEQSDQRLRDVTEHVPALIAYVNLEERYEFANGYYRDALGIEPEKVLGQTMQEILGDAAYARVRERIVQALAGYPIAWENWIDVHGEQRYFKGSYMPDYGAGTAVKGMYIVAHDMTASRRAEEARKSSDERFRLITESASEYAILGLDPQGQVETWNSGAQKIKGYAAEEIIGRHFRCFYTPEDVAQGLPEALLRQAEQTGRADSEGWRIRKDGSRFWASVTLNALRSEAGDLRGYGKVTRDLTERKATEEALKASSRQLQTMTDNIPALISYLDSEQRFRFANRAYAEWFGSEKGSPLGQSLREYYGEAAYAVIRPHIERALAGERVTYERELATRGGIRHMQVTAVPDVDGDGSIRGLFVLMNDITERKAAEVLLAASEDRLRTIANNLPALVCMIDRQHVFRFNNRTYERWLGRPLETITGHSLREVYGEEIYAKLAPSIEQALGGERVKFEIDFLGRDGRTHFARGVYVPQKEGDGTVSGIYGLINDVTSVKEAEAQLWRLAQLDSLTGLANRYQFEERLTAALARPHDRGFAVMFLDIDRFKSVNDSMGHETGDDVLKEFANRLVQSVRPTDLVARLAGDEFVVLLEGLHTGDEAQFVARKILHAIRRRFEIRQFLIPVSTSIGIAVCRPEDRDIKDLLRRADAALYQAKAAGRDDFRVIA